jgi:DNA-binding XRE family transcriptional regulator
VGEVAQPSLVVPQREEIATILPRLEDFWALEAEMLPVLQSFSVLLAQEETQKLLRKNLGVVRRLRSLTTDALAKSAGISASTLGRVEAGKATMSLVTLRAVATALGVKVEVLLREDLEQKLLAVL